MGGSGENKMLWRKMLKSPGVPTDACRHPLPLEGKFYIHTCVPTDTSGLRGAGRLPRNNHRCLCPSLLREASSSAPGPHRHLRLAGLPSSCSQGADVPTHSCRLSSPLMLSWNILHFSPPTLSKQVVFLLWKDAHCSLDIKDRSSLFSLKAAIGEARLYYADLS